VATWVDSNGLGAWKRGDTIVDDSELAVVPGFMDTHSHLLFAGWSVYDAPVDRARSLRAFVDLTR
jgi:predicted amidohydrolase YtcJ